MKSKIVLSPHQILALEHLKTSGTLTDDVDYKTYHALYRMKLISGTGMDDYRISVEGLTALKNGFFRPPKDKTARKVGRPSVILDFDTYSLTLTKNQDTEILKFCETYDIVFVTEFFREAAQYALDMELTLDVFFRKDPPRSVKDTKGNVTKFECTRRLLSFPPEQLKQINEYCRELTIAIAPFLRGAATRFMKKEYTRKPRIVPDRNRILDFEGNIITKDGLINANELRKLMSLSSTEFAHALLENKLPPHCGTGPNSIKYWDLQTTKEFLAVCSPTRSVARVKAIAMFTEDKKTIKEISEVLNKKISTVYRWIREDVKEYKPKHGGNRAANKNTVTIEMKKERAKAALGDDRID